MTEQTQELRKGINKIEVAGVVKEHKLKEGEKDGNKYINGSLVIKAGEFTEVEVKLYVGEKSKEGKIKKGYTTLKSILDEELLTMAKTSEEEAVKVRVFGNGDFTPQIREEMYVTDDNADECKTKLSLDLGFGNVSINETMKPEDYKATFEVEMFIAKIENETKKVDGQDEETGRVVVKGYTPVHGGSVIPLEIKAGIIHDDDGNEINFGEQILAGVSEQSSINLWGNVDYRAIIEVVKKGGGLGVAKTEEKRTYIHDLVATGGDIIDVNKEFDAELIKQALVERDNKKDEAIAKAKERAKENSKGNKKGLGKGTGTASKTETKPKSGGSIPF
jgi:hypothetical protein